MNFVNTTTIERVSCSQNSQDKIYGMDLTVSQDGKSKVRLFTTTTPTTPTTTNPTPLHSPSLSSPVTVRICAPQPDGVNRPKLEIFENYLSINLKYLNFDIFRIWLIRYTFIRALTEFLILLLVCRLFVELLNGGGGLLFPVPGVFSFGVLFFRQIAADLTLSL